MRSKNRREPKLLINFYLEKSLIRRCDEVVDDPDNIFEDRSTLIRYCVKQQIPLLEAELKKQKEETE